jgi:hypothetical protein
VDVLALIYHLGATFTTGVSNLEEEDVCAKGKALVILVYRKRMWTKFNKPSSKVHRK